VGHLQAELNSARLQEFEAQENAVSLAGELEEERSRRLQAETELQELRMMKNNLDRVSRLVATEMTALRELCQQEKEEAQRMKLEAVQFKIKQELVQIRMALSISLSKSLNLTCAEGILAVFGTNHVLMKAITNLSFLLPGIINAW
jgi:ABC-type transporter Mla MlaB component